MATSEETLKAVQRNAEHIIKLEVKNKWLRKELEFIADEWEWCPCGAAEHAKKALENDT